MRRFGMALVLAVSVLALVVPVAAASPPEKYSGSWSFTDVVTPIPCGFVVTVTGSGTYAGREYFDQNGLVVRTEDRDTEQDTFSANGKTLVGEPYSFNMTMRFDSDGKMTSWVESGFSTRVRLPDGGGLFINVGHFNVLGGTGWTWKPDHGHTGDIDAFCAALAP
jgi:hypothetical protein